MATQKITSQSGGQQPLGRLPSWWDKLKATSFAAGVKEADRYLKNAEAQAKKAKVHPVDSDRFLDVKYSSAAGQYGYLAAMILVDGFIASCPLTAINFAPDPLNFQKAKYPSAAAEELANRQWFLAQGPTNRDRYIRFLKLAFSDRIADLFDLVFLKLHMMVHYRHSEQVSDYESGIQALKDFKSEFTNEAKKQLKAAGVSV